jgi:hypothetical protein
MQTQTWLRHYRGSQPVRSVRLNTHSARTGLDSPLPAGRGSRRPPGRVSCFGGRINTQEVPVSYTASTGGRRPGGRDALRGAPVLDVRAAPVRAGESPPGLRQDPPSLETRMSGPALEEPGRPLLQTPEGLLLQDTGDFVRERRLFAPLPPRRRRPGPRPVDRLPATGTRLAPMARGPVADQVNAPTGRPRSLPTDRVTPVPAGPVTHLNVHLSHNGIRSCKPVCPARHRRARCACLPPSSSPGVHFSPVFRPE